MPTFNVYFPDSINGQELINVKAAPYNAAGDGSTDDTVNLQNAFDAAWGTRTAPFGLNGAYKNRSVFLPPGDYKTTAPLYITGVQGSRLFGDSAGNTTISFLNPMTDPGTVWPHRAGTNAGHEISPALCFNGCANFALEGIAIRQLNVLAPPANLGAVGIDYFNYGHSGGGIATLPVYRNMIIKGFQHGMSIGYGDPGGGNSENGTLYNVWFEDCSYSGLMCFHQNVLNWNVFGGGAKNCAHEVFGGNNYGAVYKAIGGAISTVSAVKMERNGRDFDNGGGAPMSVFGGYSSSDQCVRPGSGTLLSGFTYKPPNSLDTIFLSGGCCASACIFAPENDNGPGAIADLTTNGRVSVDGMIIGAGGASSSFKGSGLNAVVYARGCPPYAGKTVADLFAQFTGQVKEYEPDEATYAFMPALDKFRSRRRIITDSPATSGLITAGGGTNHVLAYCRGATGWQILGPVDA
jgi:Pectate lyase superfamily protein